jgi:hypothetical protein
LIRSKPTNWAKLRESFHHPNGEIEYGSGGEQMVEDVHVGDNVTMKCDDVIDEDYWILLCDNGLHMIQ